MTKTKVRTSSSLLESHSISVSFGVTGGRITDIALLFLH